jgi:hypothetical protein
MRKLLVAAALVLAACEKLSPPGECADHLDCRGGQECSGGVCIRLDTDHQVGSRCIRDMDCAAWADCNSGSCALTPGMCASAADCPFTWQQCSSQYRCAAAPGMCAVESDCSAWQDCAADHTCVLTPGMCGTSADCAPWQICDGAHSCVLAPSGCIDDTGCGSWQQCVSYRCASRPGFCSADAECAAWDVCDATHVCVHGPGYCGSNADCAAWQQCDVVHACVTAPGFCADDTGCTDWEHCGTDHVCALDPGRCLTSTDCPSWQTCDSSHVCEDRPGTCSSDSECRPPQTCVANLCSDPRPGPFDTAVPLMCGTLLEGTSDWTAVARLDAPASPYFGFGRYTTCESGVLNPSGELVYHQSSYDWILGEERSRLRIFRADSWTWDSDLDRWVAPPPEDRIANDPIIPTPACDAEDGAGPWVMQAGTGEILYSCDLAGVGGAGVGDTYYDSTGAARLPAHPRYRILSWNANGAMLVTSPERAYAWFVLAADGSEFEVTALPLADVNRWPGAFRAHADGFRVIVYGPTVNDRALWFVDALGNATRMGTYPPGDEYAYAALDVDGNGYFLVRNPLDDDEIQRCAPDGVCTTLYSEAEGHSTTPPAHFLFHHTESPFVTAP